MVEDGDEEGISFRILALMDLKAQEEVVLGWEWDDENVVHHLPALIQSPLTFPGVSVTFWPHAR